MNKNRVNLIISLLKNQSMQMILILLGLIGILIGMTGYAYSQETSLATFQETAQIIIDKSISQNVTASIALQSTSIQEIKIPAKLEQKIRENGRITAIIVTNQNHCILGVFDESCVIINVARNPADNGIFAIQNSTKIIAESFIDELNKTFDTDAKFHSIFIQSGDEMSKALETSGSISGKGTVSAVYTMPMEDTSSMYEKISALLLPREIRDKGGFYDVAKNLSREDNAKMTFSIIPIENKSLLQLKLSVDYPNTASLVNQISPLEFLKTNELKRSDYFSSGFYPLNSILQVVVLSPESTNVSEVRGNIVPTQLVGDEKIPTEIKREGWVFDPDYGKRIQGKFIFGERKSIDKNELMFSLGDTKLAAPKMETSFDESIIIVIIISVSAIGAAAYYLKGYRK
ncbi:hypothetical protein YTPLAS73_14290 [Nitrosarchaeum sp.]|nr:hypothetical protein YTPLAS73_14290 [Nitrosarchaeum sp.]